MDKIYIFETACSVENKHLVVRVDPAVFDQAAQRCHAGRAFGTEKNTLCFSHSGNFHKHLIIAGAQCRAVAIADGLQH